MARFDGSQCEHFMTSDAYWDAIDESDDRAIAQARAASKCLMHHGCRCWGRMVAIGAECSLKCEHYEYNDSMNHQCVGILGEPW
jgi:hypothetical protein